MKPKLVEQTADTRERAMIGPASDALRTGIGVPGHFTRQAAATPLATALSCAGRRWSYAEVEAGTNRLARQLAAEGVVAGTRVALLLPRGEAAILAMLAVLKAGAAFVPLDSAYPMETLAAIVGDAAPVLVLAAGTPLAQARARPTGWPVPILDLDRLLQRSAEADPAPLAEAAGPEDPAYVMYTSGSTGAAKGVIIPHRGIIRLVVDTDFVALGPDQVILQLAPLSFDASTLEIWGSLLTGGRLAILPGERPSLDDIAAAIAAEGVTTLWLTAGLFHLMVDHRLAGLAPLRQLLAGGDVLSPPHVARAMAALPHCRLINGYGPTENTAFTCCHTITTADCQGQPIPIGRPIAGTSVHVLDEQLQPVAPGAVGQLATGGAGVALGYLGRAELTAEKFIPDPFAPTPGGRLYLTGDLVRARADGVLLFHGRADRQIKLNGKRVELDEIETLLRDCPAVRDAVVSLSEAGGRKRIIAYLAAPTEAAVTAARDWMRARAPEHMVPAGWVRLDALPLNPNGKVDRLRLPPPPAPEVALDPANGMEALLSEIWRRVLGVAAVSRSANFFDLGGTSLQLLEVHAELQREIGPEITLMTLLQHPQIADLAAVLLHRETAGAALSAASGRAERGAQSLQRLRRNRTGG